MTCDEPAFPGKRYERKTRADGSTFPVEIEYPGISARQYFVAQAMTGLLAGKNTPGSNVETNVEIISRYAIIYADACLAREMETREK